MRALAMALALSGAGLLGAALTFAQERPAHAEPCSLKEIVKQEIPLTNRVFFVLDVSASMTQESKITRLLTFVRSVAEQPLDELQFALEVFNNNRFRWEGFPDQPDDPHPVPKLWAKLPSADALAAPRVWLAKFPGDGSTAPEAALADAISEPRENLSVVFVTDGDFDIGPARSLETIDTEQHKREENGLGRAVVMAIGLGVQERHREHMSKIGREGKGGYFEFGDADAAIAPVRSAD